MTRLASEVLGPYNENARDLAIKLEQTLVDHLPEYLYNGRVQLCGGRDEASNGFNMWIRLHRENVGDSEVIEYADTECLRTYGKCTKRSEVSAHMDGWISLFDRYGQELVDAHRMTRNMFLNILPVEMKNKINEDPKLNGKGFRELAVWVRSQVLQERQEALAEVTKKVLQRELGGGKIHALAPKDGDDDHAEDVPPPPTPDPDAPPRWAVNLEKKIKALERRSPGPNTGRGGS